MQVTRFAETKDDCDSALKLELNVKTLLRRGTSWLGLQEIDSARKDFKHVLSLEPNNRCDNRLLLTMECSAAFAALTFCVTTFMLETLNTHGDELGASASWLFLASNIVVVIASLKSKSYHAEGANCVTGKHVRS